MAAEGDDIGRDGAGRFRAGTASPNPKGRPRKGRGVDSAVLEALGEKVVVTERGTRKRKTKLAIAATQIANKSASGDLRAAKIALEQARKAEARAEANAERAPVMTHGDDEIAARLVARIAKIVVGGAGQ